MDIEKDDLLRLYYFLKLTRRFEDRITALYRQGRILGGVWTSNGMEAISVGYACALDKEDVIAPYFRDMGAYLARGITVKRIMAQYMGKKTGVTGGKEGNVHVGDISLGVLGYPSHLADNYPVAVGVALSFKIRGETRVAAACTGDGGTSRGDFHEAMNMASVWKVPVVFVCNNNQYAYSTPLNLQMAIENIAERALAYSIPAETVDGNDVIEVFLAVKRACERARAGNGPSFIECKTMRMHGHSEHDAAKYVPRELLEDWKKKDPVIKMENYLLSNNVASQKDLSEIDAGITKEISEAEEFAEKSPLPEGEDALKGVYATTV